MSHHPMSSTVQLSRIVATLDELMEGQSAFLERASGEVVFVLDPMIHGEDIAALEPSFDDVDSDAYVALPTRFDIHEWSIMRDFCDRVEPEQVRQRLLRAVHGRGAFRRFKDVVDEEELRTDWFAFRDARLTDIARDWLEAEGIPFVDDVDDSAG